MAIYIDKSYIPDADNLDSSVLEYITQEHNRRRMRLDELARAYRTNPAGNMVRAAYPHYIVTTTLGLYLGDPVRYTYDLRGAGFAPSSTDKGEIPDGEKLAAKPELPSDALPETDLPLGASVPVYVKDGRMTRITGRLTPAEDLTPVLDCYKRQHIADVDTKIGLHLGIFGEAYELLYASDDENPYPKSAARDPRLCEMVRDTTVDHKKICFCDIDVRRRPSQVDYYVLTVYSADGASVYESESLTAMNFTKTAFIPHFFGEVPAVEYQNGPDRLGDFEPALPLIRAYDALMTDRIQDKANFVESILAIHGYQLTDEQRRNLKEYRILDGLPTDATEGYIANALDETSVHVLADDLVREIHKQSMTVDLSDESFAGNASGQALKLKLLTMTLNVKKKITAITKGLTKRAQMYSQWLAVAGAGAPVDRDRVNPVFTLSIPIDEAQTVATVTQLQGIVDDETLLSLLWFVKDPAATLAKVKEEKKQRQNDYMDAFGISAAANENGAQADNGTDYGAMAKEPAAGGDSKTGADNQQNQ